MQSRSRMFQPRGCSFLKFSVFVGSDIKFCSLSVPIFPKEIDHANHSNMEQIFIQTSLFDDFVVCMPSPSPGPCPFTGLPGYDIS